MLYLALDACDPATMLRLVAEGRCPNLAGMLSTAATVETVAPYGTFVGSTWMTLSTALRVGHHRYFNWLELDADTYEYHHTTPRDARGTPFWLQLSEKGRRVGVFDVPHADVPAKLDGVLVKEWGCHDRHHGTASFPAEILAELDGLVGGHPYGSQAPPGNESAFAPCDYTHRASRLRTLDEERQLLDVILAGVDAKGRASQHLLQQGGWDAFITVVGESHCVGHQLWHVHDETHPRHDLATRMVLGDPVEQVYERLDTLIGEHVHAAGPGATTFIHLSHGMQAHYDGDHLLDEVLRRLEMAHDAGDSAGWRTRAARRAFAWAGDANRARLQRLAGAAVRHRIDAAPPPPLVPPGPSASRRWYQVPNNTVLGAIRFNMVGREPHGCSHPDQIAELTAEITAGLLEVVNVDTGRSAVLRVVRTEDVLERSEGDPFPDLFVEWDRRAPIERVWSPQIGTVAAPYLNWRTGDHRDRGLLIVHGPGISPGRRAQPMVLEDVAPTLSAVVGVELDGVDGAPRRDLLDTPETTGGSASEAEPTPLQLDALPLHRPVQRDLAEGALELALAAARRGDLAVRTEAHLAELAAEIHRLRARADELERSNLVWTTMRWLDGIDVEPRRLVSVITPTYKRPEKLAAAIRSVMAQSYPHWEMLVVDDGSETAESVVAEIGDERVRAHGISHRGSCAARNEALLLARGEIITYLDDDNTLDPGWLKAVVWGFETHPEADVLYGARLVDDVERVHERGVGGWPWVHFDRFSREDLLWRNLADMGAIAHRSGIPGAQFDERLWECGDWDFLLAITENSTPLELPVLAFRYYTDGTDRLTGQRRSDNDAVRDKWRVPEQP